MRTLKAFAVVAALLMAVPASAAEYEWTWVDTTWEATYLLAHSADWAQTRYIAKSPIFEETNPILGRNPSLAEVNRHFILTGLGHVAVAALLPNPLRRLWQVSWLAVEVNFVQHNYSAGVKLMF